MNSKLKNILCTLAFPLAVYAVMELLCFSIRGSHVIASILDLKNFIRNVGITCMVAYALSFNLGCGRFDLSLGTQRLVSVIIGGNVALSLGLTGIPFLLVTMLFGLLFGTIVGLVFVTVRVPPMVLGIGMGLIYECIAYVGSGGKGLTLTFQEGMSLLTEINFTIAVIAVVAVVVLIALVHTRFGYQMRAIQGSQRIAQASGIKIFRHTVLCYMLGGGVISISGTLSTAFEGSMGCNTGFSSNGAIFGACFPMFLGRYMARWSNQAIGILVATITIRLFTNGLSALKLTTEMTSVINMLAFLGFLAFRANEGLLQERRAERDRIAQAQALISAS